MKAKNLRIGMNVRFKDSYDSRRIYKIIGRDERIRSRFTVATGKCREDDGYFMTFHHIHENELERV